MERTSSKHRFEDLHVPMPDGRLLILRRFQGGTDKATLIVPRMGRTISDRWCDDLATHLCDAQTTTYLLEVRGHGLSEGKFSISQHARDIAEVVRLLHQRFSRIYIIAHDLSATILLQQEHKLGSAVHGMLLIDPALKHKHAAEKTRLLPVRVEVPTIVFSQHQEVLKRIFGSAVIRTWHEQDFGKDGTVASMVLGESKILAAMKQLYASEKPIRFAHRATAITRL